LNILITGSTGFVGENLKPYLTSGIPGISIKTLEIDSIKSSHFHWSDLNINALKDIDAIIHLAGKAHDVSNNALDEDYDKINFGLTKQIYDLFLMSEAKKFIFISTVKAAADIVEGILTEDHNPCPVTSYGISKLKAETYIRQNEAKSDKTIYILRPCMMHGAGNKGNLNLLYKFVKTGIPYPLAAYHNKRSFFYIENFCFVIKEILNREIESGTYNLSDDPALSTVDLIRLIAKSQNKPGRLLAIPQMLVGVLAKVGDILHLPLNSRKLMKLTENYVVDNTKIKAALGISSFPYSTTEGLQKTLITFANKNR